MATYLEIESLDLYYLPRDCCVIFWALYPWGSSFRLSVLESGVALLRNFSSVREEVLGNSDSSSESLLSVSA
jgi:hypothetical protein